MYVISIFDLRVIFVKKILNIYREQCIIIVSFKLLSFDDNSLCYNKPSLRSRFYTFPSEIIHGIFLVSFRGGSTLALFERSVSAGIHRQEKLLLIESWVDGNRQQNIFEKFTPTFSGYFTKYPL